MKWNRGHGSRVMNKNKDTFISNKKERFLTAFELETDEALSDSVHHVWFREGWEIQAGWLRIVAAERSRDGPHMARKEKDL